MSLRYCDVSSLSFLLTKLAFRSFPSFRTQSNPILFSPVLFSPVLFSPVSFSLVLFWKIWVRTRGTRPSTRKCVAPEDLSGTWFYFSATSPLSFSGSWAAYGLKVGRFVSISLSHSVRLIFKDIRIQGGSLC